MVTAKIVCYSKEEFKDEDDVVNAASVEFTADYAGGRNQEWAGATPFLALKMKLNGGAAQLFEQGKRYTLLFEEDEDSE